MDAYTHRYTKIQMNLIIKQKTELKAQRDELLDAAQKALFDLQDILDHENLMAEIKLNCEGSVRRLKQAIARVEGGE